MNSISRSTVNAPLRSISLSDEDSQFVAYLRAISIAIIVFGHVGGFWAFEPFSGFLHVFVPLFFFLSGAVSYFSYEKSKTLSEYYRKRLLGLLVPYYLLCVFSLAFFIATNASIPSATVQKLLTWLTIRPDNELSPFGIGQVWFLHTLFIISLVSPVYFELYRRTPRLLVAVIIFTLIVSAVQTQQDIHDFLCFSGHNLFKPLIHSVPYVSGFVYFTSGSIRSNWRLIMLIVLCMSISVGLARTLCLDIDFGNHTFSPDLYYMSGSLAAIAAIMALQRPFLALCKRSALVAMILRFVHRYTFPIFLLHSFSIYLTEELFGLVHPKSNYIVYGIVKFAIVMGITCMLSIPFGAVSTWLTKRAVNWCARFTHNASEIECHDYTTTPR